MMPWRASARRCRDESRQSLARWVVGRGPRDHRAFATLVVLLAVGIATVILVSLQSSAFRQASAGRESLARIRAKWAARAGLEATIARLEFNVQTDENNWSATLISDLQSVSGGRLDGARWEIVHATATDQEDGPADPHAKVNVNRMSANDLMELQGMTEDVAAAIIDWIDEDDIVSELGAEDGYYSQLPSPYKPRNGPLKSLAELELVAGVDPVFLRGEDWNLNGRLDPNEDDGDLSPPADNADGVLDAGWSALITTESVDYGLGDLGKARLDLTTASADQLVGIIKGINSQQADTILSYATQGGARLENLISTPLRALAGSTGIPGAQNNIQNLDDDQIQALLDLATTNPAANGPLPGRININTCSRKTLDYIELFRGQGEGLADLLILWRDQRPNGFNHILDLLDVPGISRGLLAQLSTVLDVQSNSYVVTSRGRDTNSGIEVEIVATIERTALPVVITEMQVK